MKGFKWIKIVCAGLMLSACASSSKLGRGSEADDLLSESERRKFDYYFLESLRLKNQGKQDAAFDLMKKAVAIDTTSAAAGFELANYYLKLGRPLLALDYLQGATRRDPDNYWYSMLEARLLQNLNMSDEAVAVYSRLAEKNPDNTEINYALADVYTQRGETEKAIAALDKMEENTGVMEPISLEKHRLYMTLDRKEEAFQEVRKLIAAYPTLIQYQILLGDLYLGAGMLTEAKAAYDQAALTEPDNVYLLLAMANYYNSIGDITASNKLVKDALVNEKLDVDTKVKMLTGYLSTLLQKKESLNETDSLFTTIIDQHPQVSEVHALYAEVLVSTNRMKEAREQLGFAVDFNPNERNLWMQLIGVDMRQENWAGVVESTEKGMHYVPEMPELYLYQGVGYSMMDKQEQALKAYQKGLEKIDPKNVQMISTLWGQIGDVYYKLDQIQKAYDSYDEALKYNEKNAAVLNNYSYFLSLEGKDLSKAERLSGKAVELEPNNATYLDTYAWIYFKQGNYMLAKFYIQSAVNKADGSQSAEVMEHYGDILFMNDEKEAAVAQWKKAQEMGNDSEVLKKKIETKNYIKE
ncbi:MAG: tetratricopeptide repeat protein [Bacteroidales bacterium]